MIDIFTIYCNLYAILFTDEIFLQNSGATVNYRQILQKRFSLFSKVNDSETKRG